MAITTKSAIAKDLTQAFAWKKQFDARPDVVQCWVDKARCKVTAKLRVIRHDDTWNSSTSQRKAWYSRIAKDVGGNPMPSMWVVDESSDHDNLRLQRLSSESYRDEQQAQLAAEVTVDQYGVEGTNRFCHYILPDEAREMRKAGITWYYYRADAARAARGWIKQRNRKAGEWCVVWKSEEIYYVAHNKFDAEALEGKVCWIFRRYKQQSLADLGWECEDFITRDHEQYVVMFKDPVTNEELSITRGGYSASKVVENAAEDYPNFEFLSIQQVDAGWAQAVEYDAIESMIADDYEKASDPLLDNNSLRSISLQHIKPSDGPDKAELMQWSVSEASLADEIVEPWENDPSSPAAVEGQAAYDSIFAEELAKIRS